MDEHILQLIKSEIELVECRLKEIKESTDQQRINELKWRIQISGAIIKKAAQLLPDIHNT